MIFYHGSSSIFLNNIKEQGLKANPPQKTIYDYSLATLECPSLVSLRGIYFSKHKKRAYDYAKVTCEKYNGNPLIISCSLNLDNCIADEDHIRCWIEQAFTKTMIYFGFKENQHSMFIGYTDSNKRKDIINTFSYFVKRLLDDYIPNPLEKLDNMFNACVDRYSSHLLNNSKQEFYNGYQSGNALFKTPEIHYTIEESEIKYSDALNSLCYSFLNSIRDYDKPTHSLRYPYDIQYEIIKLEELDLSSLSHQS